MSGKNKKKQRKVYRKRKNVLSEMFVGMVVAFLVVVTGISSLQLKQKNMQYAIREAQLDMEIQAEKQRSEEIEELKEYVQTDEFIRNTAREKLGMADPEEIIFKQR